MAGPRLFTKDNFITMNYMVNELLKPDVRKHMFDDVYGLVDVAALLYHAQSVVYGIMEKGLPEPIGVVFFTGVIPYRDCTLYAAIFDKKNRGQGKTEEVYEKIKTDIIRRYSIHSVTSYVCGKNEASSHVLEKLGFKKIGVKKKAVIIEGKHRDLTIYYLLSEEGG